MSYAAASPEGLAVEVFVFREGRYLGSTVLSRPEVILGSAPTADVVLKSRQVAPSHAMVTIEDGQMVLTDLQSATGSFVNGHKVERVYVGPLDEVGIGSFSIKLAMHQRGGGAPVFEGTAITKLPGFDGPAAAVSQTTAAANAAAVAVAPAMGGAPDDADSEARTAIVSVAPDGTLSSGPQPPRTVSRSARNDASPPVVKPTGRPAHDPGARPRSGDWLGSDDRNAARAAAPAPSADPWAAHTATERPRALENARTSPGSPGTPGPAHTGPTAYAPTVSGPAVSPPTTSRSAAPAPSAYSVIPPMPAATSPQAAYQQRNAAASTSPASSARPGSGTSIPPPAMPSFEDALTQRHVVQDATEQAHLPEFDVDVSDTSTNLKVPLPPDRKTASAAPSAPAQSYSAPPPVAHAPAPVAAASAPARAARARPAPIAPSAPAFYVPDMTLPIPPEEHDEDDHDEDEASWVEPFSVADGLIGWNEGRADAGQPAAMSIVHTRDGDQRSGSERPPRLVEVYRVEPGRRAEIGRESFLLGQSRGMDGATLFFREHWRGVVCLGGHERPLANLLQSARQVRKGVRKLELNIADWVQLETDRGDSFHVRVFRPPPIAKPPSELKLDKTSGAILGSSTGFHLAVLLIVGFLAGGDPIRADAEVFAEVKMEELDLKLPETAAPETAAPETAAPTPEPEKAVLAPEPDLPAPPKDMKRTKTKSKPVAASVDAPEDVPVKSGAVAALEALRTSDDGRADIRKAVTNLTLVKGPAGMSSPFKTSAAMEKLPGGSLRMTGGSGKGAGVAVRTGGEAVDGTLGAKGTAIKGAKSSKGVGGTVVSAPASKVGVSGSMDRSEILKVVNAHLAEIRRCYQKAIVAGTASSGKAVFEWTIKGPGSVAGVRVKVSSLKNPTVEGCIMDSIKKWKFPAVKGGGSVVVSFPFVFTATDF